MNYILTQDVLSTFKKGVLYGRSGEIVEQISASGDVLIVQSNKHRFPIHKNKVKEFLMNKDLSSFKKLFDYDKVKPYPTKLEYRVPELETALDKAAEVIKKHKLQVKIVSTGELATYKAFEVHQIL